MALTGIHHVRALLAAFSDARHILPRSSLRAQLRRQVLKLRFWPQRYPPSGPGGQLLDLDWSYIQAMKGSKVGELRIHDRIGDCDNLRAIFYVPDHPVPKGTLPVIWVLAVMQKKRNDFTAHNLKTFEARRQQVEERFYRL